MQGRRIKDFENYSVFPDGRIYSHARSGSGGHCGMYLRQRFDKNGYALVNLQNQSGRTTFKVHRLVATYFVENISNLPEVNHLDNDRINNNSDNLEWCDRKHNMQHMFRQGRGFNPLHQREMKSPHCKVSDDEISEIRNMRKMGIKLKIISNQFNLSISHTCAICLGKER